jgi:hypothetical protein
MVQGHTTKSPGLYVRFILVSEYLPGFISVSSKAAKCEKGANPDPESGSLASWHQNGAYVLLRRGRKG